MTHYIGVSGSATSWLLAKLPHKEPCVVICKDRAISEALAADLRFFLREAPIRHFTGWDTLPFEPVSPQVYLSAGRIATLYALRAQEPGFIVTSVDALLQRVLAPELLIGLGFNLSQGAHISRSELLLKFDICGFRRVSLVEEVGEIAVRGGVIDFFPSTSSLPIRLEFLGDTIEKLRLFASESQRTCAALNTIRILPVQEFMSLSLLQESAALIKQGVANIKRRAAELETPAHELNSITETFTSGTHFPGIELIQAIALAPLYSFFDYLPRNSTLVTVDQGGIDRSVDLYWSIVRERLAARESEHYLVPDANTAYLSKEELYAGIAKFAGHVIDSVELASSACPPAIAVEKIEVLPQLELATRLRTQVGTGQALAPLKDALDRWRNAGSKVAFAVAAPHRAERLQRFLLEIGVDAQILDQGASEWPQRAARYPVVILLGHLQEGFQLPAQGFIFVSERDIFGERSYRKPARAPASARRLLSSLSQLREGDYLVHIDYGIGIYRGLNHKQIGGVESDLLHIEYADSKLFLPVQNIGKIQKFIAAEGKVPALAKLGSRQWLLTKQRVRRSVEALAGQLIKLYAARSISKGWRFDHVGSEDERFADGFPFSETPDQLRAIEETLVDMGSEKPMDRLICGDVGFGKTEVALRAAFKCIQHARQVAVLAPTTLLVEQHKYSFMNRFLDYPVKIAALSRFYPQRANKETLELLAQGDIDIVIGTHRLIQNDVRFRDLGLVIIDEEHRFGVKQKERLKQLRTQVDVITLTATPIPRTLHMGLLGIRDISVINSPPYDRHAIQTHIAPRDDALVRDAILRELQRAGQVFYVYNRVQSIDLVCAGLQALVPEARFAFAHGQMAETQLENIMRSFMERKIDVLVTTTIIESGLDIPNANTIMVERADTYGLAQLYQLRGRVGRSSRQAYAYLLIPRSEKMGEAAHKRLKVLQSLDELGAGFNLAVKDLEIRGAGNLLGGEQSGNVLEVGFELYSRILKEAVAHLKGEPESLGESLDPEVKLAVSSYIPHSYIPDISERLLLYQRLASAADDEEVGSLRAEIEDRFGPPPIEVASLIELSRLRVLFRRHGIIKADLSPHKLALLFGSKAPIDSGKIIKLVQRMPTRYKLRRDNTLLIFPEKGVDLFEEPKLIDEIRNALSLISI